MTSVMYEQPINELIRTCLRIEFCCQQFNHALRQHHAAAHLHALKMIIEIADIIDRPDLKGKFAQEYQRQLDQLHTFTNSPNIDPEKLTCTIDQLVDLNEKLNQHSGKLSRKLSDNKFIQYARQHLYSTYSAYAFDSPALTCWQQSDSPQREQQLKNWLSQCSLAIQCCFFLLEMTRKSNPAKRCVAERGFFERSLDPQFNWQLIRVESPLSNQYYPEISVGRHRLCIRFIELNTENTNTTCQTLTDITFQLACCQT